MARLPSERYLIQQHDDGIVYLFEEHTEVVLVHFDPKDTSALSIAQKEIEEAEELSIEDKALAHFWCGYFYAHAHGVIPPPLESQDAGTPIFDQVESGGC